MLHSTSILRCPVNMPSNKSRWPCVIKSQANVYSLKHSIRPPHPPIEVICVVLATRPAYSYSLWKIGSYLIRERERRSITNCSMQNVTILFTYQRSMGWRIRTEVVTKGSVACADVFTMSIGFDKVTLGTVCTAGQDS